MTTEFKTATIPAHTEMHVVVYGKADTVDLITVPELGVAIVIKSDVMKTALFNHPQRAVFSVKLATALFTMVERKEPRVETLAMTKVFVEDVQPVDTAMLENLRVLEMATIASKDELEVVEFADAKYETPGPHDIISGATDDELLAAFEKVMGNAVKVGDPATDTPAANDNPVVKPTLH